MKSSDRYDLIDALTCMAEEAASASTSTWRSPMIQYELPDLLTPAEVAAIFRVDPKTVTRWASIGRLSSIRTPGGHRRYFAAEVKALRDGKIPGPQASEDTSVRPEPTVAGPQHAAPGSEVPGPAETERFR